jgi:phosphopantetheinyl transferase
MPLYQTITHNSASKIYIWKIEESFETLTNEVVLNHNSQVRLNGMKSELHQRGFLSVRKLLQHAGYSDLDLYYDAFGKPHLNDGMHISITHSHEFSAIILSDQNTGIDIERRRDKIINIADKFVDLESRFLDKQAHSDYISRLTVIWGVKESVFKICNEPGISFKNHIQVDSFQMNDSSGFAVLKMEQVQRFFEIYFEEIENFNLVYAFEKEQNYI